MPGKHPYLSENFWIDKYKSDEAEERYSEFNALAKTNPMYHTNPPVPTVTNVHMTMPRISGLTIQPPPRKTAEEEEAEKIRSFYETITKLSTCSEEVLLEKKKMVLNIDAVPFKPSLSIKQKVLARSKRASRGQALEAVTLSSSSSSTSVVVPEVKLSKEKAVPLSVIPVPLDKQGEFLSSWKKPTETDKNPAAWQNPIETEKNPTIWQKTNESDKNAIDENSITVQVALGDTKTENQNEAAKDKAAQIETSTPIVEPVISTEMATLEFAPSWVKKKAKKAMEEKAKGPALAKHMQPIKLNIIDEPKVEVIAEKPKEKVTSPEVPSIPHFQANFTRDNRPFYLVSDMLLLENLGLLTNELESTLKALDPYGIKVGLKRTNKLDGVSAESFYRGSQRNNDRVAKIIILPDLGKDVKLNTAENAWKPKGKEKIMDESESEKILSEFRLSMNKIALTNFDRIMSRLVEYDISSEKVCSGVIEIIFDKAIIEPQFVELYAKVFNQLRLKGSHGDENNFRLYMMDRCKDLYGKTLKKENVAEGEEVDPEQRLKKRDRIMGNIILISELYKQGLINENVLDYCVTNLNINSKKSRCSDHEEVLIECQVMLLTNVGKKVFSKASPQHAVEKSIKRSFSLLGNLRKNKQVCPKTGFKIQDLLDLPQNNWQPRASQTKKLKTREEIRRECNEKDEELSARASQAFHSIKKRGINIGRKNTSTNPGSLNAPNDGGGHSVHVKLDMRSKTSYEFEKSDGSRYSKFGHGQHRSPETSLSSGKGFSLLERKKRKK